MVARLAELDTAARKTRSCGGGGDGRGQGAVDDVMESSRSMKIRYKPWLLGLVFSSTYQAIQMIRNEHYRQKSHVFIADSSKIN